MLIYDRRGVLIGNFEHNDKVWSGTAAKKIWNKYLMIRRESKKDAEVFVDKMKFGGICKEYMSVGGGTPQPKIRH